MNGASRLGSSSGHGTGTPTIVNNSRTAPAKARPATTASAYEAPALAQRRTSIVTLPDSTRTDDKRTGQGNETSVRYTQADRDGIVGAVLHHGFGGVFRKHSRIVAVQENQPFEVETDRGVMFGAAGDWVVTNHPEDDNGSDVWSISNARMEATYHPADLPVITSVEVTPPAVLIRSAIEAVRETGDSRPNSVVITKLEEALLWLNHETVVGE